MKKEVSPETWKQYEKYCITRLHYKNTTIEDRKRKLKHLEKHGINLLDFNPEQAYDYFAERIKKGAKGYQLNSYIKALNSWCKYRNINHHFTLYRAHEKPIKIPTAQDINKILNTLTRSKKDQFLKAIIVTLAHTGMRISELCNLKLDDIDWQRNEITVTGKGDKTRIIPVKQYYLKGEKYPSLKNYIQHHRPKTKSQHVFINPTTKKPATPALIRRQLKKIVRKAGMGWIHPHSFRHFYATNLLKNGVNIKAVQILLGHSTIKITSRYLHMVEYDIRKTIEEIKIDDIIKTRQKNQFLMLITQPYGENQNGPGRI